MSITIIVIYTIAITLLFFYCIMQLSLAIHYIKFKRNLKKEETIFTIPESEYPYVTVQLPVFNELYVVERLIDAIAAFDYPADKLEIQLLDDSTDESFEIARKKVDYYHQRGIDIKQIRRPERKGFKAGALEYGLREAKGEYVAIFDADFVPFPDFLKKTIPHFLLDDKIGVVQAKWDHLNKDYSILTKMQAFALDMHFTIEQQGRNAAGYFINFNGTAGVWRKATIEDAGGWKADTLTEDLDLSYRAQLKGWKFKYVENVVAPAELPTDMNALKSQQFRWNKGGAETAKKIGLRVINAELPLRIKLHAVAHLFNTTNYIFILITAILSVPLLFIKNQVIDFNYFKYASIFLMGSIAIAYAYYISTLQREKTMRKTLSVYITRFPIFLAITMGMSLHNAWAVFRGWLGQQTAFVRTPKFNIVNGKDIWKNKKYTASKISPIVYLEGLFSLYFLSGIIMGFYYEDYGLLPFHMLAFSGFALIFYFSLKHSKLNS
ncbi:MAG: cellulose synthase family protein [Chitinophagales bacterium]|jgi:cellulose synthase/poly-beta-1,6-N-acetylglucosamine synthase-like glycosyltransferase|nr:glycosyltransferase [Bacteroidota bacterium]MBP9879004.1 glycosyltransferase family 2 protein [Chitinophagales bacterium]MBL0279170.1 glycosyltransferase [Bacteroidota bacterium]HRG26550.1 glycosyltransferase family 2 protein [Chitinophagales bacterium]HRG84791.1 glycosyltransferase family 2 protein [Chitinophagales bacterium]